MKDPKRDPQISAVEFVHDALKDLTPEQRKKVLASVSALLDIPGAQPTQQLTETFRSRQDESKARGPSLIELIKEKQPGTNSQRIALFAYYRERYEGLPRFQRNDLEPYFANAREQPPTNFDRDFVDAVRRGWIHEAGNESYITSTGIESVEAGFQGERKVRNKRKAKAQRTRKSKGGRSRR